MFDFLKKKKKVEVQTPFAGEVKSITDVPDPVFSQKMVGDGFAVEPGSGRVRCVAPISGELSVLFPTGHAYGIKDEHGLEVLVHLGLDTVELSGDGFTVLKKQGEQVTAGEPIIEMDVDKILAAGKASITPVVFTNQEVIASLEVHEGPSSGGVVCTVELK